MPARPSRNQDLVLGALRAAAGRALTAYEVLAQLGPAGIRGPQTVYRAPDALQQAGLIHRIESLNAFTLCVHDNATGHHGPDHQHDAGHRPAFAVCRGCSAVRELEDAALAAVLGVVADRTGFRVEDRVIELVGACPACAKPRG
ncbi:Fur family transcriptional regulator [Falsiroseomonas sp. HC035]|uniref:Fur family transcriptional regulator n=1 Tax=Falsiroseomonas sp. HC035 TaxID=3390999 RepID=UPI003D323CE8